MKCEHDNCFTCPYPDCIKEEKPKPDRSAYMHEYYMKKKLGIRDNTCRMCGKIVEGEMIRIHSKNYCSMDCVLCHLYDANERYMKIVNV